MHPHTQKFMVKTFSGAYSKGETDLIYLSHSPNDYLAEIVHETTFNPVHRHFLSTSTRDTYT